MSEIKIPTEVISLPTKGLLYSKDNLLSKGEIEMSYMTAKHEDILTNTNYIKNGTVIDKFLQALIATPINIDDMITANKDDESVDTRILGNGKEYSFKYTSKGNEVEATVDLTSLKDKEIDESLITRHVNSFEFNLPKSGKIGRAPV